MLDAELTPQYYRMNPAEECVIPSGKLLTEGMVVLLENPSLKADIVKALTDDEAAWHANIQNRWCRVTHLDTSSSFTVFVGVYADNWQATRVIVTGHSWIVKIDSMFEKSED